MHVCVCVCVHVCEEEVEKVVGKEISRCRGNVFSLSTCNLVSH